MKILIIKNSLLRLIILSALFLFFSLSHVHSDQGGVNSIIKKATLPLDDEKKIDTLPIVLENTIQVIFKNRGKVFWTETRKDKIERFKCSQCHNNKKVYAQNAKGIANAMN